MTAISGKAALVTGGGGGIGRALALALAARGAAVAVADILPEGAERTAALIAQAGGRALALRCDVCERASIADTVARAAEAFGPVRLLFANAGATSFDPLAEMSDADVDWIVQVNLMGVMNTVRAVLPAMVEAGGGHIVATASIAGLLPGWLPHHAPYSAAKAGVLGLMMNLALEVKARGVGVTTYCPGGVASNMKANNARYRPERFGGPGEGGVHLSQASAAAHAADFYTPDAIAPLVLQAVERDRPLVFDHASHRQIFRDTYASLVEAAFDDCEAYVREAGGFRVNPTGATLPDD